MSRRSCRASSLCSWCSVTAIVVTSLVCLSAQAQTALKVDAVDLIAAHKAGGNATAPYQGKLLEVGNLHVNGFFPISETIGRRNPALDLRTSKYFDYISCESSPLSIDEWAKLAVRQSVVVVGTAAIGTYSLRLTDCKIIKLVEPILPPSVNLGDTSGRATASDLMTDYLRNSIAAAKKYKGKQITISGKATDVQPQRLTLRGTEYNSIRCAITAKDASFLQSLPSGQSVVVKGTPVESDGADLQVKDCTLVEPVAPVATPAAAPAATPAATPATTPTATPAATPPKLKTTDLKSYYPTAVHSGGSWTMNGIAGGIALQVRQDEKEGSATRGKFFVTVAGSPERAMTKAELRAFYDGMKPRAMSPNAAPFDKELVKALASALGLKPPKLP
ncbi:MAG: hypothetical protein JNM83_05215 [Myxococcales bacterium]|jgi:hypothetical protein|nr:hypothetical protein [Myxococcales bacterium]